MGQDPVLDCTLAAWEEYASSAAHLSVQSHDRVPEALLRIFVTLQKGLALSRELQWHT